MQKTLNWHWFIKSSSMKTTTDQPQKHSIFRKNKMRKLCFYKSLTERIFQDQITIWKSNEWNSAESLKKNCSLKFTWDLDLKFSPKFDYKNRGQREILCVTFARTPKLHYIIIYKVCKYTIQSFPFQFNKLRFLLPSFQCMRRRTKWYLIRSLLSQMTFT